MSAGTVAIKIDDLVKPYVVEGRVDVTRLASDRGIKVFARDDLKDSGHIQFDPKTDTFSILVNAKEPATRQRFTIAHEFSHYLLHEAKLRKKGSMDRANETVYTKEEREADLLASEILMPSSLVKQFLESEGYASRLNQPDTIAKIAEHFRVSKTAAVQRLRELNYNIPFISFA